MFQRRHAGILALVALFLTGCLTTSEPEKPPAIKIDVAGREKLNPTANGESTPVVVKLFALRREAKFSKAGFFGLYDNPKTILGNDLVTTEQVTVKPQETMTRTWVLDPGTNYIGALAAFRNIDQSTWRTVTKITRDGNNHSYTIHVGRATIKIAGEAQG